MVKFKLTLAFSWVIKIFLPMVPYWEINVYSFPTVFLLLQFWAPAFYVSLFSIGAEEQSKECSVHIVLFQCNEALKALLSYLRQHREYMKRPRTLACTSHGAASLHWTSQWPVTWKAVRDKWKVSPWARTGSQGHCFSSSLIWQEEGMGT